MHNGDILILRGRDVDELLAAGKELELMQTVGKLVYELGVTQKRGTVIPSFLPKSWLEKQQAMEATL